VDVNGGGLFPPLPPNTSIKIFSATIKSYNPNHFSKFLQHSEDCCTFSSVTHTCKKNQKKKKKKQTPPPPTINTHTRTKKSKQKTPCKTNRQYFKGSTGTQRTHRQYSTTDQVLERLHQNIKHIGNHINRKDQCVSGADLGRSFTTSGADLSRWSFAII
jgi:hypothetical protein